MNFSQSMPSNASNNLTVKDVTQNSGGLMGSGAGSIALQASLDEGK